MIRARSRVILVLAATLLLAFGASPAMAADGVGLWGRTDDKVVTFWGFGVMIFFTLLVVILSIVQIRLESRKERIEQDLERLRRP